MVPAPIHVDVARQISMCCGRTHQESITNYAIRWNAKLLTLQEIKCQREQKANDIGGLMFAFIERDQPLIEFDVYLWATTIDIATVHDDGGLLFRMKGGMSAEA